MAISKDPTGTAASLFGIQQLWPKWKSVTLEGTFSRNFTDATYDGLGGTNLMGGSTASSFSGIRTFDRWTVPMPFHLSASVGLAYGSAFSLGFGGGHLYTHMGSVSHPTTVDEPTGFMDQVILSCEWGIDPVLPVPPPGDTAQRGPADGIAMRMVGSVSSVSFGWAASTFNDTSSEFTIDSVLTGFNDVIFNLGDLAAAPFSFSKSYSYIHTFHPSAPDTAGPPAYYPMRGSTTLTKSAALTLQFNV